MNDFKRHDRFGGKQSAGGFNRPRATMHDATCATCGASCQVPFRPTGERPVYCRNCFTGTTSAPHQAAGRREYPKRPFPTMPAPQAPDPRIDDVLRQLVKVQDKLERILLSLAVAKAQSTIPVETVADKPKRRTRKK